MINNPGDRFISKRGVIYVAQQSPVAGTCNGCAGDGRGITPVCRDLPTGCSYTDIIWIKAEDKH